MLIISARDNENDRRKKKATKTKTVRPILEAVLKQGVLRIFQHGVVWLGISLF